MSPLLRSELPEGVDGQGQGRNGLRVELMAIGGCLVGPSRDQVGTRPFMTS